MERHGTPKMANIGKGNKRHKSSPEEKCLKKDYLWPPSTGVFSDALSDA